MANKCLRRTIQKYLQNNGARAKHLFELYGPSDGGNNPYTDVNTWLDDITTMGRWASLAELHAFAEAIK